MKQIKLLALSLTLLMGISFTSCLDGNSDPMYTLPAYAECISMYPPTFQLGNGQKLIVSNTQFMPTEGKMYAFYYQFNSDEQNADAQELKVTLVQGEPQDITAFYNEGPLMNSETMAGNAPMVGLSGYTNLHYGGTLNLEPMIGFSNNKWLFMHMPGWIATGSAEENAKELKKHSFVLTYEDNENQLDGVMELTLHHCIDTSSDKEGLKRDKSALIATKAYNMSYAFATYKAKHGKYPSFIKINAKVNRNSNELGQATDETWTSNQLNFK